MGENHPDGQLVNLQCGLTLEDEFTLTRVRNNAYELQSKERDQFLWTTIYRLVCRERAYRSVISDMGVLIDVNIDLFDDTPDLAQK